MSTNKVKKSIEMTDVQISFISLVDRPANKRPFLITKGDEKQLECRILKADDECHTITSVVYEPLKKDAHDNFMTAEQIEKTAHWFLKNGNKVDFMHNFVACDGCSVVESYIVPEDVEIGGEIVTKGTWVATVEVNNDEIWGKVKKGLITGFSMGGIGVYAKEDIDLDEVKKSEKEGILKRLSEMLGISKGEFKDEYDKRILHDKFYEAFDVLQSVLRHYDFNQEKTVFVADEKTITDALNEFNDAIRDVLHSGQIMKCLENPHYVTKSGRKISGSNAKKLSNIQTLLEELLDDAEFDEKEIEKVMDTITDAMLDEKIEKKLAEMGLVAKNTEPAPANPEPTSPSQTEPAPATPNNEPVSQENIDSMVAKSLETALPSALEKALEPYANAVGLPSNLNDQQPLEKSSESNHYMHGFLF